MFIFGFKSVLFTITKLDYFIGLLRVEKREF